MVEKILEVRGDIPAEVIQAAMTVMKWSAARCEAVQAQKRAEGSNEKIFSMNKLAAPDGTLFVVCGPEHAFCLNHWFERHTGGAEVDSTVTHDDHEHGPESPKGPNT